QRVAERIARNRHGHTPHPEPEIDRALLGVGLACRHLTRSMIVAVARAPPAHMVISAVDWSDRSSSCSAVVISRAPVAPTGWPSAMAPPLTLTRSRSG